MRGAGAPAFLPPAEFVRIAGSSCGKVWTPDEALAYTRWLATHHYENFHVVSFLLPKRLHQDFYNVYSYCRWADDLGDEIGDTRRKPAPARLVARRTGRHVCRAAPRIRCSSRWDRPCASTPFRASRSPI